MLPAVRQRLRAYHHRWAAALGLLTMRVRGRQSNLNPVQCRGRLEEEMLVWRDPTTRVLRAVRSRVSRPRLAWTRQWSRRNAFLWPRPLRG